MGDPDGDEIDSEDINLSMAKAFTTYPLSLTMHSAPLRRLAALDPGKFKSWNALGCDAW